MLVMTIAELMKSHQTYIHRPPYAIVAYTLPTGHSILYYTGQTGLPNRSDLFA
jgi:hypothetical protein